MEQLFEKFGIHTNLIIAQMVNFGILFFVLYKFAYRPILRILDERRERIESSLKQAKEIEQRTERAEEEIADQLAQAKKHAEGVVAQAKQIGEEARTEILARANKEVTQMIEKTKADLETQKDQMMSDVRDYVVQTSVLLVEKILRDKLDSGTKKALVLDSLKEISPSVA